jgi:hypothetical protein
MRWLAAICDKYWAIFGRFFGPADILIQFSTG